MQTCVVFPEELCSRLTGECLCVLHMLVSLVCLCMRGCMPACLLVCTCVCALVGCADLMTLDTMTPQERKRQGYIHELIQTEETYVEDLELVLEVKQRDKHGACIFRKH